MIKSVTLQEKAHTVADLWKQAQCVVALTGAGISTAAGLPDFRGPEGLYQKAGIEDPERIFDIGTFRQNPSLFYRFHRAFLRALEHVEPTFAHRFLAEAERCGRLTGVITQNIDALHQRAGSHRILEIHGSVWESFCTRCHARYDYACSVEKTFRETVPRCDRCQGVLKPDVVFFGEGVKQLEACQELVTEADLLVVLGTSLTVMPAALLPSLCRGRIVVVSRGNVAVPAFPFFDRIFTVDEDLDRFFCELSLWWTPEIWTNTDAAK